MAHNLYAFMKWHSDNNFKSVHLENGNSPMKANRKRDDMTQSLDPDANGLLYGDA